MMVLIVLKIKKFVLKVYAHTYNLSCKISQKKPERSALRRKKEIVKCFGKRIGVENQLNKNFY